MISNEQIEQTATFKQLTAKTPFLRTVLINHKTRNNINNIVYQIEKFGIDYIVDKNYSDREVRIAKDIVFSLTKL